MMGFTHGDLGFLILLGIVGIAFFVGVMILLMKK